MATSQWDQHDMEAKVTAILSSYRFDKPATFGTMYPFLSAYQIAIDFASQYPETLQALGYKLGGVDTGDDRHALTTYIASEISHRVQKGQITWIEGGWLSAKNLTHIEFSNNGEAIVGSSYRGDGYSIYRYCGDD